MSKSVDLNVRDPRLGVSMAGEDIKPRLMSIATHERNGLARLRKLNAYLEVTANECIQTYRQTNRRPCRLAR